MNKTQQIRFVWKPLAHIGLLLPAGWAVYAVLLQPALLGANPVEALLDHFGNWGLRVLMLGLAVTPLRYALDWPSLTRFRRLVGLYAFVYIFLHFLIWLLLDQGLSLGPIIEDIAKRPFITIGMAALVLLTAMAATSFAAARRSMGRRWQLLHNSVYAVGILAIWHYWWQVKADILEPLIYALILSALLGYRLYRRRSGVRRMKPA